MSLNKDIQHKEISENQFFIYSIGQSGYIITLKGLIIYIDPYLTDYIQNPKGLNENYMYRNFPSPIDPKSITKCDAIICTHSHVDHMDPWTINQIKTKFQLFTSIGAYEKSNINLPKSRVTFLYPEVRYQIGEINIIPFPAAHYELTDEYGRPDCLSILIEWKDKKFFFWGDGILYSELHGLLSKYNFNYFFAPINGRDKIREKRGIVGNIKENELAEFCSKLTIDHIIPNHYNMFKNNTGSVDLFKKEMLNRNSNQSIIVMDCGDKLEI